MVCVTVVTVCYNAEKEIAATMRSVCQQDYPNIEYLIIDGASKDSTVRIAERIRDEYSTKPGLQIRIVSEPDHGIYDAMNKAIAAATGDWVLFMNAGDLFYSPETVTSVFRDVVGTDIDGIYGDTLRFQGDWSCLIKGKPLQRISTEIPLPFCHQSVFVRTSIAKELLFDTTYKLAGDYHFFTQCYLKDCKFIYAGVVVSRYAMGGVSETNTVNHLKEKIHIRQINGLEKYSKIKAWYLVLGLHLRQRIKKVLPKKIVKLVRGF